MLSEIFEKNTKKNSDGAISNVICNSAKQGLIPQREYFDKDIANSDNTAGYYIIEQNDFVYNISNKSKEATAVYSKNMNNNLLLVLLGIHCGQFISPCSNR